MVVHEVQDDLVRRPVYFLITEQLLVVADAHRRQNQLRQLCEDAVLIVLANGEIDVVACDHIEVELAELLDVAPLALVLVADLLFRAEAVPELEELHCVFGSFFEHNQPIDVPSVKSHPVLPIQHQLSEKLEGD